MNADAQIIDLRDLPSSLLNPESHNKKPEAFSSFQEKILEAEGLHVVTPEYNGSFPGVLKLFIDFLKFPESFQSKPVAYTGLANGRWGALRAIEQLQMVFGYRNAFSYPERLFIPGIKNYIEQDRFIPGELEERIDKQVSGFQKYIGALNGE